MLKPEETEDVTEILADIVLQLGVSNRTSFFTNLTQNFVREMNSLITGAPREREYASTAIRVCMERGWADTPTWMETLLNAIDQDISKMRQIRNLPAILTRLAQGEVSDPRRDASDAELVMNDVPFLDRTNLRNYSRELLRPDKRPILVISGDKGSGRSYCAELFNYISAQTNYFFKIARVKIEPGQGQSYTPKMLAKAIVGAMERTDEPKVELERDTEGFKNFVLVTAKNTGDAWWIILDGFNDLPPESDVRKLIQALATSIADERYRQKLRLVLTDYKGLQLSKLKYIPHEVKHSDVQRSHIRSYFAKLNIKHNLNLPSDELDDIADSIWNGLPNDSTRLEEINRLVTDIAYETLIRKGALG